MTAAKGPPERVTLWVDDAGHVWVNEDDDDSIESPTEHEYELRAAVEKRERADTEKVVDTVMRHYLASGQVVSELPDIIRAAAGGKL